MEEHSELSMEPLSAARMATNPLTEKSKAALRKSLAESGKVADYPPEELWKVAGVGEDGLMNREEFESMLDVLKEHVLKQQRAVVRATHKTRVHNVRVGIFTWGSLFTIVAIMLLLVGNFVTGGAVMWAMRSSTSGRTTRSSAGATARAEARAPTHARPRRRLRRLRRVPLDDHDASVRSALARLEADDDPDDDDLDDDEMATTTCGPQERRPGRDDGGDAHEGPLFVLLDKSID